MAMAIVMKANIGVSTANGNINQWQYVMAKIMQ
jgi:hypothetical protein